MFRSNLLSQIGSKIYTGWLLFFREVFLVSGEEYQRTPTQCIDKTLHYQREFPGFALDGVFVATEYTPYIAQLLREYKFLSYPEKRDLILPYYRDLFVVFGDRIDTKTLCVPVPMHWSRYLVRGFDHIQHLCRGVEKDGYRIQYGLIGRSYSTQQHRLGKQKRLENAGGHFFLKAPPESGVILLFDDVISTGATVHSIAELLKSSGVEKVYGFFLASGKTK